MKKVLFFTVISSIAFTSFFSFVQNADAAAVYGCVCNVSAGMISGEEFTTALNTDNSVPKWCTLEEKQFRIIYNDRKEASEAPAFVQKNVDATLSLNALLVELYPSVSTKAQCQDTNFTSLRAKYNAAQTTDKFSLSKEQCEAGINISLIRSFSNTQTHPLGGVWEPTIRCNYTEILDPSVGLNTSISALNPLKASSIPQLIGYAIRTIMGIVGSIALLMFAFGGVTFMMAAGNSDRARKGINTMLWAGLGVIVMLSSYIIISFILEAV